ncbi:hypothetical protein ACKXGF_04640 [Alkalibacillus sp. S2W]|uniref:hypothetical protein n=1 Tax=Alkalibacillus sp. S2W TaxID=3386553 RepID=UPI00398D0DA9
MKLRIPLFIITIGLLSGIYQRFGWLYLHDGGYLLSSIQFIGSILLFIMIFERTKISEKKVHFITGFVLIISGVLLDYYLK